MVQSKYSSIEKTEHEIRILEKLRKLKQGMMDDLLTGRVQADIGENVAA